MTATANATDAMIRRLEDELEERNSFVQGLVANAQDGGRDLNGQEMELIGSAQERIGQLSGQLDPLRETSRITVESRRRMQQIDQQLGDDRRRGRLGPVEYRNASQYILDRWRAAIGDSEALERVDVYERAAAHQTTADNPGIIPAPLLEPIVNRLDVARPLVAALGPRPIGAGGYISQITQHTLVAKQTAEKAELASRKMIITKTALAPDTFGGYVNVSRQNIDWSDPNALQMVIDDLTDEYSIQTEAEAGAVLTLAASVGPQIPLNPVALDIAKALWSAAGTAYAGMRGVGRLVLAVAPDRLGLLGPLFPNVNPQNTTGAGMVAGEFMQGPNGSNISGVQPIMSAGLAAGTMLVINTAAATPYEDRVGALQAVEPSVLGVQVAYAGYFKLFVRDTAGVIAVTQSAT